MKALITGDEGFIGRNFRAHLERWGWDVDGCDIKSGKDCRDLFKTSDVQYDLVIHCAAIVGGRLVIEGEPLVVASDLAIDSDMFNWAARTKPKHVVYFSSSAAYPMSLQMSGEHSLAESDLDLEIVGRPDQTYGWVKVTGEMLAVELNAIGIPTHVFRPFSGYGSDQDLTYPFPSFIERAIDHRDPFEIWGDGTQVRDFIHVTDIVEIVFAALEAGVASPINLCTGVATSFNDLAKAVCREESYRPEFVHKTAAPVGALYRVGDPTIMNSIKPARIDLEEGIWRAVREMR